MTKNNLPVEETRNVIITFIVEGGTDSGYAFKNMSAALINEMDDLLERMLNYARMREENENAR